MNNIVLVGIIVVLFFVIINYIAYKLVVNRAIRKFIKPFLNDRGWTLLDTQFVGIFRSGDFKLESFEATIVPEMGKIFNSTYIYVIAEQNDQQLKFTARISSVFWLVKKVEFAGALPKSLP